MKFLETLSVEARQTVNGKYSSKIRTCEIKFLRSQNGCSVQVYEKITTAAYVIIERVV